MEKDRILVDGCAVLEFLINIAVYMFDYCCSFDLVLWSGELKRIFPEQLLTMRVQTLLLRHQGQEAVGTL